MYAITGITGRVGGALANTLLAAGEPVRAVLRDAAKAAAWRARGCDIAVAAMEDADALAAAFHGAEAVFILLPPNFDPSPGYAESRACIAAMDAALRAAKPARVVVLSTIGAQASQPNLLSQLTLTERTLRELPLPVTFLRPAWFMENAAWDVAPARDSGVMPSFLQPLAKPVPMVATADVASMAAELLRESWQGVRVVELEGPRRLSPNDVAAAFARLLDRDVHAEVVPRETWGALFLAQGMRDPVPRMQMLDGFNEGWIEFERADGVRKGTTAVETVLAELIAAQSKQPTRNAAA